MLQMLYWLLRYVSQALLLPRSPSQPERTYKDRDQYEMIPIANLQVEMFKIIMQGQYGGAADKKLSGVVKDMWREYGFRNGIMRGYWVSLQSSRSHNLSSAGYKRVW